MTSQPETERHEHKREGRDIRTVPNLVSQFQLLVLTLVRIGVLGERCGGVMNEFHLQQGVGGVAGSACARRGKRGGLWTGRCRHHHRQWRRDRSAPRFQLAVPRSFPPFLELTRAYYFTTLPLEAPLVSRGQH